MNLPLIDAAEYFLNLKQAAEEILPVVEEHADDGELLHALSEAAKSKLGLAIAYRVYSESLRDPSNSAIGEHFKEHSEDCLNDVDFFVRRSSVMSGGASLEGVESPPASGDLTEILQVLSKMEEANLQLMSELVVLLEGNPSKYEVEAMMAKDQHHLDDLTQHMPVAPELPSVAEELPSVEEAASPAAPLGVIGPAKMAGVSAKRGLSRVGELLSGSRVKKLEGLSEKLRDGKPLGDHAVVVNVRRLTRAQKGVEAERNSVRTARAITAIGATGVGAAGAHKLRSKKKDGEEKTSEMGAAAMGCHPQVSPPPPLTGAAAGQHAGLADKVASAVREALKSQAKNMRSHANRVKVKVNLPGAVPIETAKERSATGKLKDFFSKKTWSRGGAAALAGVSAAGAVGATHAAHEDEHEKAAARTYDMSGSKRDGRAYSMHTTPDEYELSQLISSKMDGDLRGVRGKAKNEGMLVGSGLGAVKGLKAGKGWGGGEVIRTGGGGGTVIGTFGSGGKMPKGMGADIRENQGMIRDEMRGQGIKIGGLAQAAQAGAGRLAGAVPHIGSALQWAAHGAAPTALAAGAAGAIGGAVAGGEGHRLSGALKGGVGAGVVGGVAGGLAGAGAHRFATRALSVPKPKLAADKSDSELAETGRQRAVANLASGFTSDKHTSGERHGTLAGRLGGAAVGAGAGALASRGATLPVRLAAGMGGAVIGGSMGGQIGKTIGSDHDAEKFWANHKEAAEGVAESFGRAAGRVVKHTGLHDAVVSGGAGPLVNAIKKPFVDIKDGIVSGYNKGADETKGWNHKEAGVKTADLHFGKGDHVHSVGMFVGHEPEDGNHEASARKLSELLRQHGSVNKARSAYLADHPNHFVTVAAYRSDKPRSGGPSVHISSGRAGGVEQSNLYSDVFGMGWKERHTKEAGAIGGALAGMGEKAVAALGKRGITHAGQLGGTLTHAAMGALPGAVIGAAGGAAAGGEGHRLSGALTGGVLGGAAGAAAGVGGKKVLTKALDKANTAHDPFGPLRGPIRPGTGSLDHVVPHAVATPNLHAAPDLSHFAPQGAAPLAHGAPTNAIPAGPRRPAIATDFYVPPATPAPEPMAPVYLAAPDVSKFTKPRWKIAQAKQAGFVDSARSMISRITARPMATSVGRTLSAAEHGGANALHRAQSAATVPGVIMHAPHPTLGAASVGHLHAPSGHSTLDLDLHQMAQEKKFHDSQPSWARKALTESKYVRPSGTAPDVPTRLNAGRMSPEVAASLARASKQPGETAAQAMLRLSKVAAAMRQLGYSSSDSVIIHGDEEMSPVLGKRVMRSAKQVWDKAVKQAMGEEASVGQYLQEEAAGRQAQEAVELEYLRQQLQQTTQQLEQAQAQAQEQEAQVGEMQGTIQQLQGQQAEQAQAADAAVQTARQTAEAAMSQSMRRSAELMKQTQLAAGLQNAAATMKEQLMALSQTPVPPATVGEAGELDAAAQQQVGQDQAMEEQAAMEQEAQMAAAQGVPPAATDEAPPSPPKTAGMISGAGKILRNAPGGVVGGVVGAASAAGLGALLRNKETAFLQDAVRKLEAKQQGGFLTGMMLAEARMVADRSAVMDQHPGKAALMNAVRGAGAGFALDKTIRHIS